MAQKKIEDSVSRSEMQAQITDATAAARQVIERLEEKVKSLEDGRDALIVTKDQLHADVQRLLVYKYYSRYIRHRFDFLFA